jgi:hypothetical protein
MTLTKRDDKDGIVIDVSPGAVNSILIVETMVLLEQCQKDKVSVEIHTHDDTTYRSFKYVGMEKLAVLKRMPN